MEYLFQTQSAQQLKKTARKHNKKSLPLKTLDSATYHTEFSRATISANTFSIPP